MTRRRGFSLIELIVVIASTTIIMTIGIGTLHTLMRTERQGAKTLVYSVGLTRLAEQLRDDVHAASAAEPSRDGTELRLAMPQERLVSYKQIGEKVERIEGTAQQPQRTEAFQLLKGTVLKFSASTREGATWISLELTRDAPEKQSESATSAELARRRSAPIHIEAVLAKDHRFTEAQP